MTNLDYICMKYGQSISNTKDDENILRKALGVLKEDGIYAMFLWIESKSKDSDTRGNIVNLLNEDNIKDYLLGNSGNFTNDFKDFCTKLRDVSKSINKLFFLKKILERTLTYALYHKKVKEDKKDVEKT